MRTQKSRCDARGGFTVAELVIVVAIIAVLASILIPVVGKVRQKAYSVDSENFLNSLVGAIERYHQDFRAYPGPVPNNLVSNSANPPLAPNPPFQGNGGGGAIQVAATAGFDPGGGQIQSGQFTMAENVLLGLCGGLTVTGTGAATTLVYDPALVGSGPTSLNTTGPRKTYAAYIEPNNLSWKSSTNGKTGHFFDDASSSINDSVIPEFVDRFPDPMPVLYLRAKVGAAANPNIAASASNNSVITDDNATPPAGVAFRAGQYDISEVAPYVLPDSNGSTIGVSKRLPNYVGGSTPPKHGLQQVVPGTSLTPGSAGYKYPYECFGYFQNPSIANTPRNKDGFILIGAGPDRVYGTKDDITNFGAVAP